MVQQPQQGQCTQCSANRVNSADELPKAEKAAQPCRDSQQKDKAEAAVRHSGKANHAVMAESNGARKRGTEHGTEQQHPIEVVPAPPSAPAAASMGSGASTTVGSVSMVRNMPSAMEMRIMQPSSTPHQTVRRERNSFPTGAKIPMEEKDYN